MMLALLLSVGYGVFGLDMALRNEVVGALLGWLICLVFLFIACGAPT